MEKIDSVHCLRNAAVFLLAMICITVYLCVSFSAGTDPAFILPLHMPRKKTDTRKTTFGPRFELRF
jgi:hypothetical protein